MDQSSSTYTDTINSRSHICISSYMTFSSPPKNVTMPSSAFVVTTLQWQKHPATNPAEIASVSTTFNSVTLTAVEATDSSAVEYNFTAGMGGGSIVMAEQSHYQDQGLLPGTIYDYTVQVRDLSASTNLTAISASESAVTATEIPNLLLIPNGDFENGGDAWGNAEPGGVTLSYESTGGSGDNGGYAMHGRDPGTEWAVLVNPTTSAADGGGIELASLD